MRHHFLPAVLVTICIGAASPALADDADCGLLCRLSGYLSTDHMAAEPNGGGATTASKGHKAHVAHKSATKAGPKLAAKAKAPVAETTKTAAVKPAAKVSPALAARVSPVPTTTAATRPLLAAARPRSKPVTAPQAEPQAVAEVTPVPAKPPLRRRVVSQARPPAQTSASLTASAIIPGAAPAMPMGFQPFNVSFH